VPSHLMDASLFGFKGLRATGEADPQGDIAFDEEPCSTDTLSSSAPSTEGTPISFTRFDDL
jgi:tRNA 2-thiocytidine biosynthesis protein TtcA